MYWLSHRECKAEKEKVLKEAGVKEDDEDEKHDFLKDHLKKPSLMKRLIK